MNLIFQALCTLPLDAVYTFYATTGVKAPLQYNSEYARPLIYPENTEAFKEVLEKTSGEKIKRAIQPFLTEVGVRDDVIIAEKHKVLGQAMGTNSFKKGQAVIQLEPGFWKKDRAACGFVLKHEVSHIKNNDNLIIQGVPVICKLAAAIFGLVSLTFLPAVLLTSFVGSTTLCLTSTWRESRADDFAIQHSTQDELLGGRRFMLSAMEHNKKQRELSFFNRIFYSASGENRLDILHPSLKSRQAKIERELAKKKIEFDPKIEAEKVKELTKFMLDIAKKKTTFNDLFALNSTTPDDDRWDEAS